MTAELVARARSGETVAFDLLIRAHHRRLFTLAHGVLRDAELAEEATQRAFIAIWRDLPRLRDTARFEAWSYRLLVRICYAVAKERPRSGDAVDAAAVDGPSVPDPAGGVIERDRLERGFARLSVEQRVVVAMRYLADMTPESIAEVLGIPRRTVYSRLKRGLAAMRAAIEADERPVTSFVGRRQEVNE